MFAPQSDDDNHDVPRSVVVMKEVIAAREGVPRIIKPRDSRFGIIWDGRAFNITLPNSATACTLSRESGAYVYAVLRGQERIESALEQHPPGVFSKSNFVAGLATSGMFSDEDVEALWQQVSGQYRNIVGGEDPSVTERPLYKTAGTFVRTEHAKPEGTDVIPRSANREEDCHVAARSFMKYARLEPVSTNMQLSESSSYDTLRRTIATHPLPQLIEVAMRDEEQKEGALVEAHSFIVVGKAEEEYVCFEKVGTALPWRLAPLKEIFDMYEMHFKQSNQGRPRLFWTVSELMPVD